MTAHFVKRAKERGYTGDANLLCRNLRDALARYRSGCPLAHEYIEPVRKLPDGYELWRFRTEDGIFVLVEYDGVLITFLTNAMARRYRRNKRKRCYD